MSGTGNVIEAQGLNKEKLKENLFLGVEPRREVDYFVKPFLDLQVYAYFKGEGCIGKIRSTSDDKLMKEIWSIAYENTRQSIIATKLYTAVKEAYEMGCIDDPEIPDIIYGPNKDMDVYVVTNFETVRGAAAILITEAMEILWEKIGNFYIIPSSVHELIVSTDVPPEDLRYMVREVNDSEHVDEDELLSYNIYRYDHTKKEVVMC